MQMWLVIFRGGLSSKETLTIQVSGKGVKAPHLYNLSIDWIWVQVSKLTTFLNFLGCTRKFVAIASCLNLEWSTDLVTHETWLP